MVVDPQDDSGEDYLCSFVVPDHLNTSLEALPQLAHTPGNRLLPFDPCYTCGIFNMNLVDELVLQRDVVYPIRFIVKTFDIRCIKVEDLVPLDPSSLVLNILLVKN